MSKGEHVDIIHNYVINLVRTRNVDLVRTKTSKMEVSALAKVLASSAFEMESRRIEFIRSAQPLSN